MNTPRQDHRSSVRRTGIHVANMHHLTKILVILEEAEEPMRVTAIKHAAGISHSQIINGALNWLIKHRLVGRLNVDGSKYYWRIKNE